MIAIVDYGMGNLRSVQKAIEHVGGDARIVTAPQELSRAEKVVLPGVGAFKDAIDRLRRSGLDQPLIKAAAADTPFLGICLGLQLLFDVSYEDGEHRGLGIVPGKVARFDFSRLPPASSSPLRIPQMGWNQINWTAPVPLLEGLASGQYMYFAHSYHVVPEEQALTATTTEYGYAYTSSVRRGNLFATQFHPEKSQAAGLTILRNFVKL